MLSRLFYILWALGALPLLAQSPAPSVAQTHCEELNRLALPGIVIRSATPVAAGMFTPNGVPSRQVPAFCRVVATVLPELGFEVWLPAQWNKKYMAAGNGGLAGAVVYNAMFDPLARGYATSSTDTGHIGINTNDGAWALGHMDRVINFGQRGIHIMAVASKAIMKSYYGQSPLHSYFSGCSYGGKQALTEVQKYPTDFDGVIAGDPANWWTRHYTGGHIWVAQVMDDDAHLSPAKVTLLADAVNAACDALDGVKDGVLNDPRRCHFDPATIQCRNGEQQNCLTAAQVAGIKKVWSGPRDADGQQLYPGLQPGGEVGPGGWVSWVTGNAPGQGAHLGLGLPFLRYVVFEDPTWDYRTFRYSAVPGLESDLEYVDDKVGRIFDAIDPDLRAFRANGGKLIQYHGWSDPDIPPTNSIDYYENVVRFMGGRSNLHALRDTKNFYRLYMVPGMQHCGGGPGPSSFDGLTALEQWVEHDKAPEQIVAGHYTNGKLDRTRPLCPYPQEAKYTGTGSTDEAVNFTCVLP